jgi:hypothetical protein
MWLIIPPSPPPAVTPAPAPEMWWAGYWAGFWTMFWIALAVIAVAVAAYLLGRSERLGWWWARKSIWHPGKVPVESKPK